MQKKKCLKGGFFMPLKIVRHDITKMEVDVIVNAANTKLQMGGGVCGAIFKAAGAQELQQECDQIGYCPTGEAVITKGYNLPAKYIIHTPGPIWNGGTRGEARLLRQCYLNSLQMASQYQCRSIAFPLISSGIYGYPKDQALHIGISAISEFLLDHEMDVYLVIFDKKDFKLSEKLFAEIESYIDDHYVEERLLKESSRILEVEEKIFSSKTKRSLTDVMGQLDETFSQRLLRLIDEKGMSDVETYKKANIDRKLFSKIRSNPQYRPSKATAIAFAIALELNLDETLDLLGKAGYTLSNSYKFDVIIKYFIEEGNYNIHEINEALFAFDQTLLGS
jgi:O-acetyl-ADP-ribose deacetylase (regulator of RNase III)